MKRILFVCTGNTCRSPMAEALFKDIARKRGLQVEVRSAGVSAVDGIPMSRHSSTVLRENQISETITSNRATRELAEWADLILTMTSSHKRTMLQIHPGAVDKTYTLKEYVEDGGQGLESILELEGFYTDLQLKKALGQEITREEKIRLRRMEQSVPDYDIIDPFGGSVEMYRRCAEEIREALEKLADRL
ncbi:low molecular weight protein arginine phosphatase [Paenibacillus gansuensis]|uniref:Low molecular weight protein arginine phosphatase n=1 Tax=Paenibacillus gansuensis TaxID=306542 RepID=A0ABW5PJX4_9BACL